MQTSEIEEHIGAYATSSHCDDEESKGDMVGSIKTIPVIKKALVNDLVQFDLSELDFLHKLGEGKEKAFSV